MRDQHAALIVFHAGEQLRHHHRRIWRPVAVVATVQLAMRSIDGDLQVSIAARSEDDRLLPALIDRSIADQPHITSYEVAIGFEDLFEMRGSGLFFPFPDKADIGTER